MSSKTTIMGANEPNNHRLVYLEVGRGLAALLVVCAHSSALIGLTKYFGEAPLNGLFSFGAAGVDFFFVLSGFIIFYSTSANHGNLDFAIEYLKHRLTRIFPIYWLVAVFLLPMGVMFGYWPGILTSIMDFLLWPHDTPPFVPVAWTLRHEILFYVSFLLFFISIRLAWVYFFSWSILISLTSALTWKITSPFWALYLNLHNIEFVLGILVAAYLRLDGRVPLFWCLFIGSLLFLGAGVNASLLNKDIEIAIPQYYLLYGASSIMLVAGFATCTCNNPGSLLQAFTFLGRASYSIYLIHFAVQSAVIKLLVPVGMSGPVNFTVLIVSGVIFGSLLYQYAERPLIKFARRKMQIVR
jgi:peptidoglycan/LPS O-acetylase OafA/YrhL